MNRQILIATACLALTAYSAHAARPDSVYTEHLSMWRGMMSLAWQNPALHEQAYSTSLTDFRVREDYRHQSERFVLQRGTGYHLPEAEANTFLRLSDHTAVWGKAAYMNGRNRKILWNSISDYDLLEPDILADTIGGDTHRERYVFQGGYATHLKRWHLGGEMLFRAEQEYRQVDPRMRSIVSDLTLRAGAGYDLRQYALGLSAEVDVYRQTNSVDFYKPLGSIPELQLMGIGETYTRFSGDVNDIYYHGEGFRVTADLMPDGTGAYAHLTAHTHDYERLARLLNSLPLTTLYVQGVGGEAGWRREGPLDLAVYGRYAFTKRSSDEHLAGTSSSSQFPVLLDVTMFKSYLLSTSGGVVIGQHGNVDWHVEAEGGYQNTRSRFVYPLRRQRYGHGFATLKGQLICAPMQRLTLTIDAEGQARWHGGRQLLLPLADMEQYYIDMMNHNHAYLTADSRSLQGGLRADYRLRKSGYGLFVAVRGGGEWYKDLGHAALLKVEIGLTL